MPRRIVLLAFLLAGVITAGAGRAATYNFDFRSTDNTSLGPPYAGSAFDMVVGGLEVTGGTIVKLYFAASDLHGAAVALVLAGAALAPTDNLLFDNPPQLTPLGFALDFADGTQMRLRLNPTFGLYEQETCAATGVCTATLGLFSASEVNLPCLAPGGPLCVIPEPGSLRLLGVAMACLLTAAWGVRRGQRPG